MYDRRNFLKHGLAGFSVFSSFAGFSQQSPASMRVRSLLSRTSSWQVTQGLLRDLGEFVFNSSMGGYFVVYGLEIVLLIVAIPLIGAVNVGRFREITEKLTLVDAFSAAGTE